MAGAEGVAKGTGGDLSLQGVGSTPRSAACGAIGRSSPFPIESEQNDHCIDQAAPQALVVPS
jgi:hypothetical protein